MAVCGNRYSVPVEHVGAPVVIRLHRAWVPIWRDTVCIADHVRVPDGARQRVVVPRHFEPVLRHKPRARAMLDRDHLVGLGGCAPAFMSELSRRQRDRLGVEIVGVYALYEQHGPVDLLAAMARAATAGTYSAAALALLLVVPHQQAALPMLHLPGVPVQAEVDRQLAVYEAWVEVDVALEEVRA